MQGGESIRKWSDLKGLAVVAIDNGARLGSIDDFYFQPQNHGIYALQIKTGVFGHHVLLAHNISVVGRDAVTIANDALLVSEHSDNLLSTLPFGRSLLAYRILSESGVVVGTVANVIVDVSTPTQLRVEGYELANNPFINWSGRNTIISSSHVVRYGQDVIVVTNDVAEALAKH